MKSDEAGQAESVGNWVDPLDTAMNLLHLARLDRQNPARLLEWVEMAETEVKTAIVRLEPDLAATYLPQRGTSELDSHKLLARVTLRTPIVFQSDRGQVTGYSKDISLSGMLVLFARSVDVWLNGRI